MWINPNWQWLAWMETILSYNVSILCTLRCDIIVILWTNTQVMVHEFANSFRNSVAIIKWFLNYFPSYFIKLLIKVVHIILHLFLNITMFKNSLWTFVSCSQRFVNLTENFLQKILYIRSVFNMCEAKIAHVHFSKVFVIARGYVHILCC